MYFWSNPDQVGKKLVVIIEIIQTRGY